ncbi:MAG: GNAT family N-acetyltransferase [Fimbriimonadaceae bacterium]
MTDAVLRLDRENMEPLLNQAGFTFPEARRRASLCRETTRLILAAEADVLAGYLEITRDWQNPEDLYVSSIQVDRCFRGPVVLAHLLTAAIPVLKQERFRRLNTNVSPENRVALRLCGRLGFVRGISTSRSISLSAGMEVVDTALAVSLERRRGSCARK